MSSAGLSPLGELALARGTVDRVTKRRTDRAWIEAAWKDPRSRVLVVSDGQALVREDDDSVELVLVPPEQAPSGTRFVLGQDPDGVVYFGVSGELLNASAGVRPASLREVGALLGDRDAGLLTHAVALANWHDTHTHCPLCGAVTVPDPGGHSTFCTVDGLNQCVASGAQEIPHDGAIVFLIFDDENALGHAAPPRCSAFTGTSK